MLRKWTVTAEMTGRIADPPRLSETIPCALRAGHNDLLGLLSTGLPLTPIRADGRCPPNRTGDDMNPYSAYSRRLRVSALAAVANPSYTRIDTWNLLDDACRHLAEVDLAGLDKSHEVAKVKRLMDRLACLRAVLAVSRGREPGDLPRSSRDPVHGAPRRGGIAGGASALRIWRPHSAFRSVRAVGRSGVGGPGQKAAVLHRAARRRLAASPRPTASPKACGRCAARLTMCSSRSWWCPASRTPSPLSR